MLATTIAALGYMPFTGHLPDRNVMLAATDLALLVLSLGEPVLTIRQFMLVSRQPLTVVSA